MCVCLLSKKRAEFDIGYVGEVESPERDRRRGHGEHDVRGDCREASRGVQGQGTKQVHLQIPQRGKLSGP